MPTPEYRFRHGTSDFGIPSADVPAVAPHSMLANGREQATMLVAHARYAFMSFQRFAMCAKIASEMAQTTPMRANGIQT